MSTNHQLSHRGLKNRILISMILTPAIPFLVVAMVGYHYFTTSLQNEISSRMVRIAEDHKRGIELFLQERSADLRLVSETYTFEDLRSAGTLTRVFENLRSVSSAYVDLGVFDEAGMHVAYAGPYKLAGRVYSEAEWFKEVLKRGSYISDVFQGFRKVPHFIVALRVSEGDKQWVLRATIDTLFFSDLVERVRMGKTGEAYIINKEGLFQTERRSGGALLEKDKDSARFPAFGEKAATFVLAASDGEEYLYSIIGLNERNWRLVVRQEEADAYRGLNMAAYLVTVIFIVAGAAIVLAALLMTNNIIGRISQAEEDKGRLGQQLIMAGRLAEIGEMSAGFAHEINNPLQIIRGEQTLIKTILEDSFETGRMPEGEDLADLKDSLDQIRVQVDRCGAITQGILKFARQKETEPQALNLDQFLPKVMDMVRKKTEVEGIDFSLVTQGGLPQVSADPGQLQQVLLNLMNNAIDAVGDAHHGQGGKVGINVRSTNGQVLVSVQDNGAGIRPENLERIFTPFFTTKPVGKGTGLGLSVCFGIVESMGGSIEVESQPGQGTIFTVMLPAVAGQQPRVTSETN